MWGFLYMSSNVMSPNHREALTAVSTITAKDEYLTSTNGVLNVNASVTAEITGTNANCFTGQVTVNTIQVQISASSNALLNGIIVKSLSTNSGNIYVGKNGVTTATGDVLEPGESRGYAINNLNLLYIISAASTTDIVSYEAN